MSKIVYDSAYAISLKSAKKRRAHLLRQCARANVSVNIFDAFHAKNLNLKKLVKKNVITDGCRMKAAGKKGSLACYLSHVEIWKMAYKEIEQKDGPVLIMEDDVVLPKKFNDKVYAQYVKLKRFSDWDFFYLGSRRPVGPKAVSGIIKGRARTSPGTNSGMYCYLLNPHSVPKLLRILTPIYAPVKDVVVRDKLDKINGYFLRYPIAKHEYGFSSQRLGHNRMFRK